MPTLRPTTLALIAVWSTTVFAAYPGFTVACRDGNVRSSRLLSMNYSSVHPVHVTREPGGDVDRRCDGICHVVLCNCPSATSTYRVQWCGATMPADCEPYIVAVPVGAPVQVGEIVSVECRAGRNCPKR